MVGEFFVLPQGTCLVGGKDRKDANAEGARSLAGRLGFQEHRSWPVNSRS